MSDLTFGWKLQRVDKMPIIPCDMRLTKATREPNFIKGVCFSTQLLLRGSCVFLLSHRECCFYGKSFSVWCMKSLIVIIIFIYIAFAMTWNSILHWFFFLKSLFVLFYIIIFKHPLSSCFIFNQACCPTINVAMVYYQISITNDLIRHPRLAIFSEPPCHHDFSEEIKTKGVCWSSTQRLPTTLQSLIIFHIFVVIETGVFKVFLEVQEGCDQSDGRLDSRWSEF